MCSEQVFRIEFQVAFFADVARSSFISSFNGAFETPSLPVADKKRKRVPLPCPRCTAFFTTGQKCRTLSACDWVWPKASSLGPNLIVDEKMTEQANTANSETTGEQKCLFSSSFSHRARREFHQFLPMNARTCQSSELRNNGGTRSSSSPTFSQISRVACSGVLDNNNWTVSSSIVSDFSHRDNWIHSLWRTSEQPNRANCDTAGEQEVHIYPLFRNSLDSPLMEFLRQRSSRSDVLSQIARFVRSGIVQQKLIQFALSAMWSRLKRDSKAREV